MSDFSGGNGRTRLNNFVLRVVVLWQSGWWFGIRVAELSRKVKLRPDTSTLPGQLSMTKLKSVVDDDIWIMN